MSDELRAAAERLTANSWDAYIPKQVGERDWIDIAGTILSDGRSVARAYLDEHPPLVESHEALTAKFRAAQLATDGGRPDGTTESLKRYAQMLDTYAPEFFPANDKGQVHFARVMMESVADEIRAYLAKLIPADDVGLVTEDWLRSAGFVEIPAVGGRHRRWVIMVKMQDHGTDQGVTRHWLVIHVGEDDWWPIDYWQQNEHDETPDGVGLLSWVEKTTRGDVRRLCAAIGAPLTETTDAR